MSIAFSLPARPRGAGRLLVLALLLLGSGCATYEPSVAPVPLPETSPQSVNVNGAQILAQAYADPAQAQQALGFDARGAGLLPVRFVIDNQSGGPLRVRPEQTFLIDQQGQAWPLLTAEQAYERVRGKVAVGETLRGSGEGTALGGAAGAVAGFAIGVLTGRNVAESVGRGAAVGGAAGAIGGGAGRYQDLNAEIRRDLELQTLRVQRVPRDELAYGYLFFPGRGEAESARALRLGLEVGGERRVVELSLGAQPNGWPRQ